MSTTTTTTPTPAVRYPLRSVGDRRVAERFAAWMPLHVNGHEGTTQDLSATGISFQSDEPLEVGACVEIVIDYLLDGHQYPLRCEAEVVRVEREGDCYTVGARLCTPFEP